MNLMKATSFEDGLDFIKEPHGLEEIFGQFWIYNFLFSRKALDFISQYVFPNCNVLCNHT